MKMSSIYRAPVTNHFQTTTGGTADSQIAPELPVLPKGGLVSTLFDS